MRPSFLRFARFACRGLALPFFFVGALCAQGLSIVTQPTGATVTAGQSITLSVGATGTALTYQWRQNGIPIPDATAATFTRSAAIMDDTGRYDVVVTSGNTTVTSSQTAVVVRPTRSPGTLGIDPGFAPLIETGTGNITACVAQVDGKMIVAGEFVRIGGVLRTNIARLNANGTVDTTFHPGSGPNGLVRAVALQPDGKIVIGGAFTAVDGTPRNRVARLTATGALDTTFDPGTAADSDVTAIAVMPTGKIVLGGTFGNYGGTGRAYLVQVTASGAIDNTFLTGDGPSSWVSALLPLADGRVFVGGSFDNYGTTERHGLVLLRANGTIDSSFRAPTLTRMVGAFAMQSSGKLLVGFGASDGQGAYLYRYNTDGTVDTSFATGSGPDAQVETIVVDTDDSIFVGGGFSTWSGTGRGRAAHLRANGALDLGFSPPGVAGNVHGFVPQADGRVWMMGQFNAVGNIGERGPVRLTSNGARDTTPAVDLRSGGTVRAFVRRRDGSMVIGGTFDYVGDKLHRGIARLLPTGAVDESFQAEASYFGFASDVYDVVVQPDEKVLLCGYFDRLNGISRGRVGRLNADGSTDPTFATTVGAEYGVFALGLQADGKVVIGGNSSTYDGLTRHGLVRLTATGALDPTFATGVGLGDNYWNVNSIVIQADGRILVGGTFTTYNGTRVGGGLMRLLPSGALDISFDASATIIPEGSISRILLAPDNTLYLGGMHFVGGYTMTLIHLGSGGQWDPSFLPTQSFATTGFANGLALEPSIGVIAGQANSAYTTPAPIGLARYSASGGVDTSFRVPGFSDTKAHVIRLLDNGDLLVGGGRFDDGRAQAFGLVRLAPLAATTITGASTATFVTGTPGSFRVTTNGVPAARFTLAAGSALPAWASLDPLTGEISGTPPAGASTPVTFTISATNGIGAPATQALSLDIATRPVITRQPTDVNALVGGTLSLSVAVLASPAPTYQWSKNGVAIPGATSATLPLLNLQPGDAGFYTVTATNIAGTVASTTAVVGLTSTEKVQGSAYEFSANIAHPGGNVYDQLLLTGPAATVTADPGQVTRISFLDLNDDIVQVEFAGAGTLTLQLDSAAGPLPAVKYNQAVNYMRGLARLAITGANETTNLSIFSVGRLTAVNQVLFRDDVTYDGFADIASISIASANGKFGGLRTANGSYFATQGYTGVLAPNVQFTGPVYLHNIAAYQTATPILQIGSASDVRIAGGDLLQPNVRAVQVSGLTELKFTGGTTSHGVAVPAQQNRGRLEQNGVDVTDLIVTNPSP